MAMMLGSSGGGKRGRRSMNAEINVTPFVDVMLVLLIVFMITAPMLVRGEEVTLPKTSSGALEATASQPLTITLTTDGRIFLNEENEVQRQDLITQLVAITGEGYDQLIYLRADTELDYGAVMDITALITSAGFTRIAFVTDPRGRGGQ